MNQKPSVDAALQEERGLAYDAINGIPVLSSVSVPPDPQDVILSGGDLDLELNHLYRNPTNIPERSAFRNRKLTPAIHPEKKRA